MLLSKFFCSTALLKGPHVYKCGFVSNRCQHSAALQWVPVIGLEIHAQIKSISKLFSGTPYKFSSPPNSTVAKFDASIPGTLPVINQSCVEMAVATALALNCQVNHRSSFDRKHYFYADMPQGYQITQYRNPIASDGYFSYPTLNGSKIKSINIEQIQLEQDSGKSLHDETITFVDLNRAGVGLMEIVTKPDLSTADDSVAFVKELCLNLRHLGVCGGRFAEGQFRVDVNISLKRPGGDLGTRAEVKNLSGLEAIHEVIEYEIKRQKEILESGGNIEQETRSYDEQEKRTVSMRDKELMQDYRFMPEPNLPILQLYDDSTILTAPDPQTSVNIDDIKRKMPDLLLEMRKKAIDKYELKFKQVQLLIEKHLIHYYLEVLTFAPSLDPVFLLEWLRITILTLLAEYEFNSVEESGVSPEEFGNLLLMEQNLVINRSTAKKAFLEAMKLKKSPSQIIEDNDWKMISDVTIITQICAETIEILKKEEPYLDYKFKNPNKKIYKQFVNQALDMIVENNNNKIHTKIAKKAVLKLLSSNN